MSNGRIVIRGIERVEKLSVISIKMVIQIERWNKGTKRGSIEDKHITKNKQKNINEYSNYLTFGWLISIPFGILISRKYIERINERIAHKFLSATSHPPYLSNLQISNTLAVLVFQLLSLDSSQIVLCYSSESSPHLWNRLRQSLHQPHSTDSMILTSIINCVTSHPSSPLL